MTLRQKQSLFAVLLAKLIVWIHMQEWDVTLGDGYVHDARGHMPGSLHAVRLAQDLNLFDDGKWIKDGNDPRWTQIGEYWERLNPLCRWGGRFRDANHFSLTHEGKA